MLKTLKELAVSFAIFAAGFMGGLWLIRLAGGSDVLAGAFGMLMGMRLEEMLWSRAQERI